MPRAIRSTVGYRLVSCVGTFGAALLVAGLLAVTAYGTSTRAVHPPVTGVGWRYSAPTYWHRVHACLERRFPDGVGYSNRASGSGWHGTFVISRGVRVLAAAYYYRDHQTAQRHERTFHVLYFFNGRVAVEVFRKTSSADQHFIKGCFATDATSASA
jgi:hypothetical protein